MPFFPHQIYYPHLKMKEFQFDQWSNIPEIIHGVGELVSKPEGNFINSIASWHNLEVFIANSTISCSFTILIFFPYWIAIKCIACNHSGRSTAVLERSRPPKPGEPAQAHLQECGSWMGRGARPAAWIPPID